MKKNNGMQWPIGIALAIVGVVGLGTWTIMETAKEPVEESGLYMTSYQNADTNANKIINETIAFNKKYDIKYLTEHLDVNATKIVYKITTKEGSAVNDANVRVIVTRPQTHVQDITIKAPNNIENGVYTFETKLPGIGRWNVMAEVKIGDNIRYYNIKTDTDGKIKPIEY